VPLNPTYPSPLTPQNANVALQAATMAALGLAPMNPPAVPPAQDPAYFAVRIGWQQQGEPGWLITDDVVIINCVERDDEVNRTRDMKVLRNFADPTGATDVILTTYHRVWEVMWTFYGPNSFDRARIVHSALFTQVGHDLHSAAGLYLVTSIAAPRRVPELFAGGQWWERVDFVASFNELVTEAPLVGTVASTEIIIEDAAGVQADFTVTAS